MNEITQKDSLSRQQEEFKNANITATKAAVKRLKAETKRIGLNKSEFIVLDPGQSQQLEL